MNFDSFLTSPRWEILQALAEKSSSPLELAAKFNTTVSYISQQLKLLDAAGLVVKKKTGAFLKGKPRTLFTISEEFVHISFLSNNFSDKKVIHLTDYHKRILNVWMKVDSLFHYSIEKIFWKLEEDLKYIQGIFVDPSLPKLIIISDSKTLKSKINSLISSLDTKIVCDFVSLNQFKKLSKNNFISLFDPKNYLTKGQEGFK